MNNLLVCGPQRPGGFDYEHLFRGKTLKEETVSLPGHRMHAFMGSSYPIIVPGFTEDFVVATFLSIHPDYYDALIFEMDLLEGYFGPGDRRNQHERKTIRAKVGEEEVESDIYLACPVFYFDLRNDTIVPDGDWLEEERQLRRSHSVSR